MMNSAGTAGSTDPDRGCDEPAQCGEASPDDGDALALTFAQAVAPAEKEEERDEDDEFGAHGGINGPGSWMR